jgi:hypothetical protein
MLAILESSGPPSLAVHQHLASQSRENTLPGSMILDDRKANVHCGGHFIRVCGDCKWPQYAIRNDMKQSSFRREKKSTDLIKPNYIQLSVRYKQTWAIHIYN